MNQNDLNREVARATGETVTAIADFGFIPLTPGPFERDRDPLIVDWDALDSERQVAFPTGN